MKYLIVFSLLFLQLSSYAQRDTVTKVPKLIVPIKAVTGNVGFAATSIYDDYIKNASVDEFIYGKNKQATFSKEEYDASGNFKNSVFIAPVDGFYHFDVLIKMETQGSASVNADITMHLDVADSKGVSYKSTFKHAGTSRLGSTNTVYNFDIELSDNLFLKKGDKVTVRYQGAGFATGSYEGGTFSGFKIF
jgi:hypothetical protein